MKQKIKSLQLFYLTFLVISIVYALLSFTEVLPTDYVQHQPRVLYWINLYSIVSGFGGMFLCLRWYKFRCVSLPVKQLPEPAAFETFTRWTWYRLGFLALVLLSNTVLYAASSYTETPKYCLLVTYITCVFCWPSQAAFQALRGDADQREEKA